MTSSLSSPPLQHFSASAPHDDWQLNLQLFGIFEGANAPSSRIEALLMAHVKRLHFADFVNAYAHRWWDYRRLPPGHSFMLFTREYIAAMRAGAREFVDSRGPQRNKDGSVMNRGQVASFNRLYGAIFTKQSESEVWERGNKFIVGLFKAMTIADMFGLPYDHFCQLSIKQALNANWKRVPQPWCLYSERLCAETLELWAAMTTQRLITAKHPMYAVENYCGLQIQDDYRQWLIKQVNRRGDDRAMPLSVVLFDKPQLPMNLAEQHFDAPTIRRARSLAA